jgi:hypothetical protein
MPDRKVITPDMIDAAAKVCHEANRAWCELGGDFTQPHWENAPAWQREHVRAGVTFHFARPESQPEDSHKEWLRVKTLAGWTWGETKDTEARQHPNMLPFEKLNEAQKMKDRIFWAICRAMAKGYGLE